MIMLQSNHSTRKETYHMNTTYTNILESNYLGILHRMAVAKGLNNKDSISFIAKQIGFSRQTIHKEIKRGTIKQRNTYLEEFDVYDPFAAQYKYNESISFRGRLSKIDDDKELMDFVIDKLTNKYSPEVIEHQIANNNELKSKVSARTIYNWVYNGDLGLTTEELPYAKQRTRKRHKIEKQVMKPNGGESIELRPDISDRVEFGHWEIDCVVGKKEGRSTSLLTLVERKTRYGIIIKIPNKTKKSVVNALNKIKKMFGKYFYDLFLSITADNGSEFKDALGMSLKLKNGKSIKIYYAHAYCSWERGTNENFNRMIRRWFPKGTDFTKVSNQQIKEVNDWINNYPRKQFKFKTSFEYFEQECRLMNYCIMN